MKTTGTCSFVADGTYSMPKGSQGGADRNLSMSKSKDSDESLTNLPDVPPSNLEVEGELLGRGFESEPGSNHWECMADVEPRWFYSVDNQRVFLAQKTITAEGETPNYLTVANWLQQHRIPVKAAYLVSLVDNVPRDQSSAPIVAVLKRLWIEREARALTKSGAPATQLVEQLQALLEKDRPSQFNWVSPLQEEAILTQPPPRKWLLRRHGDGILPMGKTGFLVAAGGAGKTFSLCSLAISIASGIPWFGAFDVMEPGKVLLALGEEDEAEVHRRLFWIAEHMELDRKTRVNVARNIVPMPLAGKDCSLTESDGRGNVSRTKNHANLLARLREMGAWSLIVFDPLTRFGGVGVESDNAIATRFVQALEAFTALDGAPAVICAHHVNKAGKLGNGSINATRGVSGITDGARFSFRLEPDGRDYAMLVDDKSNYSALFDDILLIRDRQHGGILRAATEREAFEARERSKRKQLTDEDLERDILRALQQGKARTMRILQMRMTSKPRRARLIQALQSLMEQGAIVEDDGWERKV